MTGNTFASQSLDLKGEKGKMCFAKAHREQWSLPIAICIHEEQLEPQEAVQVGVVVPSGFVQEEDIPVGQQEEEATESVKAAQHDAHST